MLPLSKLFYILYHLITDILDIFIEKFLIFPNLVAKKILIFSENTYPFLDSVLLRKLLLSSTNVIDFSQRGMTQFYFHNETTSRGGVLSILINGHYPFEHFPLG